MCIPYTPIKSQKTTIAGSQQESNLFNAPNELKPLPHDSATASKRHTQASNDEHAWADTELSVAEGKAARSSSCRNICPNYEPSSHPPHSCVRMGDDQNLPSRTQQRSDARYQDSVMADSRLADGVCSHSIVPIGERLEQNQSRHPLHAKNCDCSRDLNTHTPPRAPSLASRGRQRTRKFSNRTKSGCFTCRKRKKKCDEARPTCENCKRSKYTCEGYGSSSPGLMTAVARQVLQSHEQKQQQQGHLRQLQPYARCRYEPPLPAPLAQQFGCSAPLHHWKSQVPQKARVLPAYTQVQWPFPQCHSLQDPMQRLQYQQLTPRLPPLRPMITPDTSLPPISALPLPELVDAPFHLPRSRLNSRSHSPLHNERANSSVSSLQYCNLGSTPQLALGSPLFPDSPQRRKRPKCSTPSSSSTAVSKSWIKSDTTAKNCIYRLNKTPARPRNTPESSLEPSHELGSSDTFPSIPLTTNRESAAASAPVADRSFGISGKHVEVDAPVHGGLGYNIHVGDDVDIGANCRTIDSCDEEVGA